MTTKEIKRAINDGKVIVLRDDPQCRICQDFFGSLVVVSMRAGEPDRLATPSDKRQATINE